MAREFRPGMKFYEASWWRDGEEVYRHHEHAADEADMIERSRAGFADLVQRGLVSGTLEGATVKVRLPAGEKPP